MQVYLITNNINGKAYVGQTQFLSENRWKQHIKEAKQGTSYHLHNAIRKHGETAFSVVVIHNCETKEEMDFVETFYIAFLNTLRPYGYNLTMGGDGSFGFKHSEASLKKMTGHPFYKGMLGRKHSEETKEKIRQKAVGRKSSKETKEKISSSLLRWHHGTSTGYTSHRCRCEPCKAWQRAYYISTSGEKRRARYVRQKSSA